MLSAHLNRFVRIAIDTEAVARSALERLRSCAVSRIRLKMLRTELPTKQAPEVQAFAKSRIENEYSPLLAGTLNFQADALGVAQGALLPGSSSPDQERYGQTLRYAEIFPTPDGVIALELFDHENRFRRAEDGSVVQVEPGTVVTLYGIGNREVTGPLREIGKLISDEFGIEFADYSYSNPKFVELKAEGRPAPPEPSPSEAAAARALADGAVRQAARGIASAGGLLRSDLPKHLDSSDQADEVEGVLKAKGLIEVDLVVTCKSRSTQVARFPSREALEQMASDGLKCACGRDILDESIDEALSITAAGRKMLAGSYWMTVLVVLELQALGVELEKMLAEQVSGGDEMDFFVDVSGELILMELKDKEFSLGSAYSFGSKMGIYQPGVPVIITTAYVGKDARDHFEQAAMARQSASRRFSEADPADAEIEYVEGLDSLPRQLDEIVGRIYEQDAVQILNRLLPSAAASGASVIDSFKDQPADPIPADADEEEPESEEANQSEPDAAAAASGASGDTVTTAELT